MMLMPVQIGECISACPVGALVMIFNILQMFGNLKIPAS